MRGAALLLAVAVAAPAAAQQAAPAPTPAPVMRAVPMLPPGFPEPVQRERVKTVDIPQAAKDVGHNGTATYIAAVDAGGKLTGLTLKESSMSPAIDAAVKARAEGLWYLASRDKAGNAIAGTTEVRMSYARHDKDSPGGGIETYTCGDLVREYDWFTAANAARRKLFWPENAYTSLASIMRMEQGSQPTRAEVLGARKQREAMWAKLIKRCRKTPERLMLSEVDQPEAYVRLVNSF